MNTQKFSGKGAAYAAARPSYPRELFDSLASRGVLKPQYAVGDIGAGTGIFSGMLAEYVEKVFAVEPNGDMREQGERLFGNNRKIVFVDASAEHTALEDGSVDVVTAAQAFHWFDPDGFKTECGRILSPKSERYVVLVWNDRDTENDMISANFEVNRRFCPAFKGSSNGADIDGGVSRFFDGVFEKLTFENGMKYNEDEFILRNLSSSYAPKPTDTAYLPYTDALKNVFARFEKDNAVIYPYITKCYVGKIQR